MDDKLIVELFFQRSEKALELAESKYGKYLGAIAERILQNPADAAECINDTWLRAWNSIPPASPGSLKTYLGKIARELALDRYRASHARKRGGGIADAALEELSEILGTGSVEEALEAEELSRDISDFLKAQPESVRIIFIRRYWYLESVEDIALRLGCSSAKVKSTLFRTRKKLKTHLIREGYEL